MQNIVATFDDPNSARLAVSRLPEIGIARERVHFHPSVDTEFLEHAGPSQSRPGQPGYRPQGVLESIGGFFANLVESHTDESGIYAEALRRGTGLVLVQAEPHEVQRVIRLLLDCGAVHLEDRVSQWRAEGWDDGRDAGRDDRAPGPAPAAAPARPPAGGLGGAPLGTHSFTGAGAAVGMPPMSDAAAAPTRQDKPDAAE